MGLHCVAFERRSRRRWMVMNKKTGGEKKGKKKGTPKK